MNIGVAKPSPGELGSCPHFFINTHSIHEKVDTVVFEQEALKAASATFINSSRVIVTGGTGLYVKVFCEGIDELPAIPVRIREQVSLAGKQQGVNFLRTWLEQLDPGFLLTSKEIANPARLMRALEVKLATGQSILDFRAGKKAVREFRIRKIGIWWPRELLYARINERVDMMMQAGLLEEVKALYPHRHLKALQTVGYRELFGYLEGSFTLDQAVDKIRQHTRNYAKRQMTWFSKDPSVEWYSAGALPSPADLT